MPQTGLYKKGRPQIAFNMTPMIDCTFQLIIFFILTTQIASADYVRVELPRPDNNVAKEYELNKAVVNVVPYSKKHVAADSSLRGAAMEYRLGADRFRKEQVGQLVGALTRLRRERELRKAAGGGKAGQFVVELRADRSIYVSEVEPVFQALRAARLGRMYITADRRQGS
jgi:biopolymer transport protein ExbD